MRLKPSLPLTLALVLLPAAAAAQTASSSVAPAATATTATPIDDTGPAPAPAPADPEDEAGPEPDDGDDGLAPSESTPDPLDDELDALDAELDAPRSDADRMLVETVSVIGRKAELARVAGSAHEIPKEELERYEYDDIQRVLNKTAGVYVRDEDGFGLRPNIGLRGASSDRSAKVALMEDGILLSPAPYSAPAAYYFPMPTRMSTVEVFKGPAAIRHGPNTIGGAVNLITEPVPLGLDGLVDVALGQFEYGKLHGRVGWGDERAGILIEGVRLQSEGFKTLDGGGDTGFAKNEAMLKAHYNTDPEAEVYHRFSLKLGYSTEDSNETYLGLTASDFDAAPYRRYAASARGRMEWWRTQMQLSWSAAIGDALELDVTAYRHDFDRAWLKLNRFAGGPDLHRLITGPGGGQSDVFLAILRGERDSSAPGETLLIGTNDRRFVSQGVQAVARYKLLTGPVDQRLQAGLRFHHDQIERLHDESGFLMRTGSLVSDGGDTRIIAQNRGRAFALAGYLTDEIGLWERVYVTPGLRVELIRSDFVDRSPGGAESPARTDVVLIPGVGVYGRLLPGLGLLAGVHQGFSPASPGQPDEVKAERSVNYEAGVRYETEQTRAELIGYFNDYSNLTGECTLSSGCDPRLLNRQFNGGEVFVYGLELALRHEQALPWGVTLDASATYTLTLSSFRTAFRSENPLFGDVEAGDALPYLPEHQAAFTLGARKGPVGLFASLSAVSAMRDQAGSGPIEDERGSDAFAVLDLTGSVDLFERGRAYVRIDNALDAEYVASSRPFGARPGKPFQIQVGYRHHFGGPEDAMGSDR